MSLHTYIPRGIGSNATLRTPSAADDDDDDDCCKVYRGSMMGLPVAVKKLDETGLQGREQFFREVEVSSELTCAVCRFCPPSQSGLSLAPVRPDVLPSM